MVPDKIGAIAPPDSLSQRAYAAIRQAIRTGVLVHDEFYSEGELAQSMEISRTPVRELSVVNEHRAGIG